VVTLEAEPRHADVARANFARAGLGDRIELRLGPALETLPALVDARRGPFDFIFIDAHKPEYAEYLTWSLALSRPGTLIVADNIVRAGAVADEASQDANVQGVRRFNERLAAEPRVTATVVQTVGSKGYDGFALAIVNGAPRSG
jgi:predicted O-methyltransferase YrrM